MSTLTGGGKQSEMDLLRRELDLLKDSTSADSASKMTVQFIQSRDPDPFFAPENPWIGDGGGGKTLCTIL
jgi:hypothetical protein